MGGYGSGRHRRAKRTVEDFEGPVLDVDKLARQGLVGPDTSGTLTWPAPGGGYFVKAGVHVGPDCNGGEYRYLTVVWERDEGDDVIRLVSTQAHYGRRWWFQCGSCDRRAALMFQVKGGFACWRCAGLTFRSCQRAHTSPGA